MVAEELYSERGLAEATGICRGHFVQARKTALTADVDWRKVDREIALTESAARQVLCLLGVSDARDCVPPDSEDGQGGISVPLVLGKARVGQSEQAVGLKTPPPSPAPQADRSVKGLLVADTERPLGMYELDYGMREHKLSKRWLNPRVLAACLGGQLQQVQVRCKDNFRPGMRLPCVHLHDNFWKLARACPRWPGRW